MTSQSWLLSGSLILPSLGLYPSCQETHIQAVHSIINSVLKIEYSEKATIFE